MRIKIVSNIDDPFLRTEWERLEQDANIFPQSTYHWCSTWWKNMSGGRKLHIVVALDDNDKALTIAPLCIERNFGIPVLRSFPIHFGDFYSFIFIDDEISHLAIDQILLYLSSNKFWLWVRLEQISENSQLAVHLTIYNFKMKRMTGCVIADISHLDWEGYLARISRNSRQLIRKRLKKIYADFEPELLIFEKWEEYSNEFKIMVSLFQKRWADDYIPFKGASELKCWRDAIKGLFHQGNVVYYKLFFNDVPVAYRLGFLHQKTYYDWHTSYDPEFHDYHPGIMILAFMIKHFINNDISSINFMAGDYDWKLSWSPGRKVVSICMFSAPPRNFAGLLLTRYYHVYRDRLRKLLHDHLQQKKVRLFYRNLLTLKKKLIQK